VRISSAFGFYGAAFSGLAFALCCTLFRDPLLTILGADAVTWQTTEKYMFWVVSCGAMPAILNVVQAQMTRAEGAALHASIGTMGGCILNILLDPVFILPWGLGMGAAGAGLATFLSNCAACIYFLILARVKRGNTYVCMDIRKLKHLTKDVAGGILTVGIPASIQNLLNVTGSAILNNFTASYGASAVAAMGVANKVNNLPMQICLGFSQGIMPLVSYNYASGNHRRMKDSILFSMRIVLPVMALVSVCYFLGAPWFIRLFMENPEIIAYGTRFLRGMCLGLTFLCMDFLAVGVFAALGMGKYSLAFALLRKVVLEIPLLFVLNRLYPLYGIAYAQFLAEVVLTVAAIIMLVRIFRQCNASQ